jgi:Holliday junction resolvase-like predicted endonuclease
MARRAEPADRWRGRAASASPRSGQVYRRKAAPPCSSSPRAIGSRPGAGGEIDIVARRRRARVFVEVKTRERAGEAAEAVTERGKSGIVAAAEFWLAHHSDDAQRDIRFDVILVTPGRMPQHIVDTFDATR